MIVDWLKWLLRRTRREYFADFFITPPITVALLGVSLWTSASWAWPALFLSGALGWTLYEYSVHRLAHVVPVLRQAHWLHHDDQTDYIAIHPLVTLLQYAAVVATTGIGHSAVAVGFSCGYVYYSALHTLFHYARIRPYSALYRLKMRHVEHHRREVNFGVSTSLWDRLLGTEGYRG